MPNEIFKITPEQFENMRLLHNNVAIEITHRNQDDKTKSGLIIVQDPTMLSAHSIDSAERYDASQHLDRWGVVAKLPDKLHYEKKGRSSKWKLEWKTEMEIKVGDLVWADYYNLHHCPIFKVEDKMYWVVQYNCLIVAKRGEEIIPLNGFCLFDRVNEALVSKLIYIPEQINTYKGVVRYIGSLNTDYANPKRSDDIEVIPGDEVIFRLGAECLLENEQHRFFEDRNLRYEQRFNIQAVIRK
jgi:co-chaperonin GroES (HSP10)